MALRARGSEGPCVDVGKVGHTEEYRTRPGCDFGDPQCCDGSIKCSHEQVWVMDWRWNVPNGTPRLPTTALLWFRTVL